MSTDFIPLVFPPWIRWGVRRGAFTDKAAIPRGEGVTKPCNWCARQCPKSSRVWCSVGCQEKFYRIWSWGGISKYVEQRDNRTCQRCGAKGGTHGVGMLECDHILPVKDGGTDDPENLRTLCQKCHVAIGYEQRAARKARREAAWRLHPKTV